MPKMKYLCCLLSILAPGLSAFGQSKFNSVRVGLVRSAKDLGDGTVDGLLQRIHQDGYTHVISDFGINSPDTSIIRIQAYNAFRRADQFGLKLIPQVQLGSKWSSHWQNFDPKIQMNQDIVYDSKGNPIPLGCPSFASFPYKKIAYDTAMDRSFPMVWGAIRNGFNKAVANGLSYSDLAYIAIGHDEPVQVERLLVGNGLVKSSKYDQGFITGILGTSTNYDSAFQVLFAREVLRRVDQSISAVGVSTKVLISGDMWDPMANGGSRKTTFPIKGQVRNIRLAPSVTPNTGIASMPGLDESEKLRLKTYLVIAPWPYYDAWEWINPALDTKVTYDAKAAFGYLANSGFSIMYWGTIAGGNERIDAGTQFITSNAMRKNVSAARLYQNNVLGYIAGYWEAGSGNCADYSAPQNTCFLTLEYMMKLNNPSIGRKISRIIQ
jgi:hypothetical protein